MVDIKEDLVKSLRKWVKEEIELAFAQREVDEEGYTTSHYEESAYVDELFNKFCSELNKLIIQLLLKANNF